MMYTAMAIRVLLLTGCSKSDVIKLRWEPVDLEARELRLQDSKTGPSRVPLLPATLDALALGESLPMIGRFLDHGLV